MPFLRGTWILRKFVEYSDCDFRLRNQNHQIPQCQSLRTSSQACPLPRWFHQSHLQHLPLLPTDVIPHSRFRHLQRQQLQLTDAITGNKRFQVVYPSSPSLSPAGHCVDVQPVRSLTPTLSFRESRRLPIHERISVFSGILGLRVWMHRKQAGTTVAYS